jgi:hypothetical protein
MIEVQYKKGERWQDDQKGELERKVAAGQEKMDTGGKFATGINNTRETGGKICRRCR